MAFATSIQPLFLFGIVLSCNALLKGFPCKQERDECDQNADTSCQEDIAVGNVFHASALQVSEHLATGLQDALAQEGAADHGDEDEEQDPDALKLPAAVFREQLLGPDAGHLQKCHVANAEDEYADEQIPVPDGVRGDRGRLQRDDHEQAGRAGEDAEDTHLKMPVAVDECRHGDAHEHGHNERNGLDEAHLRWTESHVIDEIISHIGVAAVPANGEEHHGEQERHELMLFEELLEVKDTGELMPE